MGYYKAKGFSAGFCSTFFSVRAGTVAFLFSACFTKTIWTGRAAAALASYFGYGLSEGEVIPNSLLISINA